MCQNIDSICKKKKSSYTHHQWWWISIYYSQTKKTRPILDTPKKETYCFLANEFTLGDAATNRNVTPNLAFIQIFTGQIHFSNDAHQRTPWWCWRWWHFDNHLTKPAIAQAAGKTDSGRSTKTKRMWFSNVEDCKCNQGSGKHIYIHTPL